MGDGADTGGNEARELHSYKLYAPPLRSDLIGRKSILSRIFGADPARVTLLQAPAGYGKSTTLRQIMSVCAEQGFLTAWLTFDEADNDPSRFLVHFRALLASVRREDAEPTADSIDHSDRGYRSDWAIERLLRFGKPVALFLDDFQVLENPAILNFFREFLDRIPYSARVFISSRSTPEVGLARLIVNGSCIVLRPEELLFSPMEAKRFFAKIEQITDVEFDRIYRLSEGWPAALQLYRLSVADPTVRGLLGDFSSTRPRELVEYLTDNVLEMQAADVQEFLLRTSLLTRLNARLCDAVTGRTDSGSILLWLERSGLFVRSLDLRQQWFEYHALFASILSEEQHRRSESVALEVHGLAAKWHRENGNYDEAVYHAVACRDFTLAIVTLDQWSSQLVADALLVTLERWCDQIPFDMIARRPSLLIKNAWALIFLQRRDKLSPILVLLGQIPPPHDVSATTDPTIVLSMAAIARDDARAAFRIVDAVPIRERKTGPFAAFELAAAANLAAYRELAYDDFEGARECLAVARMQGVRGRAAFSQGYTVAIAGVNLLAQGHLGDALDHFESAMTKQRKHVDRSHAAAALSSCYLWALYEADALSEAESIFGQYQDIILESALLDFQAVAHLSMARIHDIRGRPSKAMAAIDEAEVIAHANDWRRFSRTLGWERTRRALLSGDRERAEAIAAAMTHETQAAAEWLQFSEDLEGESLGRIRLAIHLGNSDLAKKLLQTEFARPRRRPFRQIKLNLLDAQLHYRMEARNHAQRSLGKALKLAAPGGYVRCFLDEGGEVLEMLREELKNQVDSRGRQVPLAADRSFVERLLRASGERIDAPNPTLPLLLKPLTDHEQRILIFLANGVSNREMASRLFVSENTIKFHLKHIYSKLGVASRVQAIASARELGLVKR
jgi:LuxR family transcriptional regulator, maltose regulon positive regulatory protein